MSEEQGELFNKTANYRLWKYALLVADTNGNIYVKDGDHRGESREDTLKYAASHTLGKASGVIENEDILGIWDMTDHAIKLDPLYDPTLTEEHYRKGYDNRIRELMPIKRKFFSNFMGVRSLELHPLDKEYTDDTNWRERLSKEWDNAHQTLLNNNVVVPLAVYDARSYLIESFEKISKKSNKHLLAAATGAGKETSTLALLIHLHDTKKFNDEKISVVTATIPSTTSELMHELATVQGMNVGNYGYVDFSRIVIYITNQWYKSRKKDCSAEALSMVSRRATFVDSVSEIPAVHGGDAVPVLFGGYHDIALKAELHERYTGLEKRIGTLVVGEAHQMLSNSDNKMWQSLNKMFGKECFKLFVTGTPYDFIYGNAAAEFFDVSERSLFTRNDLYKDKNNNPDSSYKEYPDFNFYGIDVVEIVSKLKQDPNWKDDSNGFTWPKMFSYDKNTKLFNHEKTILWLFKRMFGSSAFNPKGDPLSIDHAPDLCEAAKKHVMVALPVGSKKSRACEYISALKDLLIEHGVFEGTIFDAYKDGLGDRKDDITNSKGRTLTLTCIKDCTGANIPELGSFVFLRKIGDSIKFFEQATGRVGRKYESKTNCGVFIGDLEASINVMIDIEEKISLERDDDFSTRQIIDIILENYNFFNGKNGKWIELDPIDFADILEELNAKGNHGINQCANLTPAPEEFTLIFNNVVASESAKKGIVGNGNSNAKNKETKVIEQLGFSFNDKQNVQQNWHNMKLSFIAKCRKLAICFDVETVAQCVDLVQTAIKNNNRDVLHVVGKGVDWFPVVMGNSDEIDKQFTNRWIQKIHNASNKVEDLFEMLEDPIHKSDSNFVAEPASLIREIIDITLSKITNAKDITVLDQCAGRGAFLYYILELAKEQNIDIRPENVYYNDIDYAWVAFFKKINIRYNLGIPTKNISHGDALEKEKEWNMEFDVIVGNPPFQDASSKSGNKLYTQFIEKSFSLLKENGLLAFITPLGWMSYADLDSKRTTLSDGSAYKFIFRNNQILYLNTDTVNKHFNVGSKFSAYVIKNALATDVTEVNEKPLDIRHLPMFPLQLTSEAISIFKKTMFSNKPKLKINQSSEKHATPFDKDVEKPLLNKTDTHIYPLYHTTRESATRWTSTPHACQFDRKVLFSLSGYMRPEYDKGIKGVTHIGLWINVSNKREASNVINLLSSKLYVFLLNNTKYSGFYLTKVLKMLPSMPVDKKYTDMEIYNNFNLTSEEIKFIEASLDES